MSSLDLVPSEIAPLATRAETFDAVLEFARCGELKYCRFRDQGVDLQIEAHPWNHHCLGYSDVVGLGLRSDSERLGASVYRYVSFNAERGHHLNRIEWVWRPVGTNELLEIGVSVSEFRIETAAKRTGSARSARRGKR